jgi:RNA polymerase sigma factor (sigma-70 family)
MKAEDFEGAVERWRAEVIIRYARRVGFRGADLDDAVQEVVLETLSFRFDPAKANGRSEAQAFGGLVRRKLMDLRRAQLRRGKRFLNCDELPDRPDPRQREPETTYDLKDALAHLTAREQEVCALLAAGLSTQEVAKRLQCGWHTVERTIVQLREYLASRGQAVGLEGDGGRTE